MPQDDCHAKSSTKLLKLNNRIVLAHIADTKRLDADGSHAVKFILMDGRESIIATARRPHPIPNKLVNIATVISLINNKRDHFDFLKLILINIFCHH
ncbi:TPA: hypothetical protein ACN7M2_000001, partial [Klebsiella pneumoniae]